MKPNKDNYREFYERITNQRLPDDWQVHHIDETRLNNVIFNLVALPDQLHTQLHRALNVLPLSNAKQHVLESHFLAVFEDYIPVFRSVARCIGYRDYLLYMFSDISVVSHYKPPTEKSYPEYEDLIKQLEIR